MKSKPLKVFTRTVLLSAVFFAALLLCGFEGKDRLSAWEEKQFYIQPVSGWIFQRIKGKSYRDDCTLPAEELKLLHVLHRDIDGKVHAGEMIVNVHIAEDVLEILKELYIAGYPIERMRLVDEYGADDETSMRDNNSSSFNFRFISHTTRISKHGLGLAVDINTLYNPYVKTVDGQLIIEPATGFRIQTDPPAFGIRSRKTIFATPCSVLMDLNGAESGATERITSISRSRNRRSKSGTPIIEKIIRRGTLERVLRACPIRSARMILS